ncbi:unnamed protein product [Trichobilharzia regenti]|nr:unnamed protein product [Trichobilharzia regenti]
MCQSYLSSIQHILLLLINNKLTVKNRFLAKF